jgi:hypothetical protein
LLKAGGFNTGMSFDTARFGEKLKDNHLVRKALGKDHRESMLGALVELGRRRTPGRLKIYNKVLSDPATNVTAKQTVAIQLGSEQLAENQELLLQHLKTRDPSVFFRIVQSLGKIGDRHALERLEKIEVPDVALSRDSLYFARSLLAYRLRLNRNLISLPSKGDILKVTKGTPIRITKAKAEEVSEAIRHVKNDLPAIPLVTEGATKLTWNSFEVLFVFTYHFHEPESLKSIQHQSALPLVLLKKADSLGTYFLTEYFFTNPSENRKDVVILGTRPRGYLTHAGKIQISEKAFKLELRSVNSLYGPVIELEGQYDSTLRSFKFSKAISGTKVAKKIKPQTSPKVSLNLAIKDSSKAH